MSHFNNKYSIKFMNINQKLLEERIVNASSKAEARNIGLGLLPSIKGAKIVSVKCQEVNDTLEGYSMTYTDEKGRKIDPRKVPSDPRYDPFF